MLAQLGEQDDPVMDDGFVMCELFSLSFRTVHAFARILAYGSIGEGFTTWVLPCARETDVGILGYVWYKLRHNALLLQVLDVFHAP